MATRTSLQHIILPVQWPRFPTYELASAVQTKLQERLLRYKAAAAHWTPTPTTRTPPRPPPPTLLTFTPAPTYTLGRRQTEPLSAAEEQRLRAPLRVCWAPKPKMPCVFRPRVVLAPRGGLATYHGPGQVVIWPVVDLRSPLHLGPLTVRDYACALEKTTIGVLAGLGVKAFTTENPGVWTRSRRWGMIATSTDGEEEDTMWSARRRRRDEQEPEEECKIAALGVHLGRHVTGLGTALNLRMPVFGPETVNPWARIVACGLEDKHVTSLREEEMKWMISEEDGDAEFDDYCYYTSDYNARHVSDLWARAFALRILPKRPDVVKTRDVRDVLGANWEEELGLDEADRYTVGEEEL